MVSSLAQAELKFNYEHRRYNDPAERDQFSKTKRHVKLNWDDIRAIQDLYDGPKSSKTRHDNKREHLRGDYTAAITLSATRILVCFFFIHTIQNSNQNSADTRQNGNYTIAGRSVDAETTT